MKKRSIKILSAILSFVLIGSMVNCFSGNVNAAEPNTVVEDITLSEKELSTDEYKEILVNEYGFSEEEADEKIAPHVKKRGPTDRLYAVSKQKKKTIRTGYSLLCMATIYVWKTTFGTKLEIDHVAAPHLDISGNTVGVTYSGAAEGSNTTTKATVDYNGTFRIEISKGVSLGFGSISGSTSTTDIYRYPVSGQFTWTLAEI